MPNIKSMDRISRTWDQRVSTSQSQFTEGVQNPKTDWAQATAAAEKNYNSAVQAAISRGSFGKGVQKAGSKSWQEGALTKGPTRWAEGVRLAVPKYEKNFSPFREVIQRTTLPPRGPKGDPANIQRVAVMAKALHDAKLAATGK